MNSATPILLIALPWLYPFALGPSPSVFPWLVTLAATASLLLVAVIDSKVRVIGQEEKFAQHWARHFTRAWLCAGISSSMMAQLQYFGVAMAFEPWINQTLAGEAFANLRQRNQFATLTNISLAALLWLSARTQQMQTDAKARRLGWLLVAASLLAVGNAMSSSRTGLFQLLLLCGVYAVWGGLRGTRVRSLLLTAVLVYAVAMFAMPWAAGLDLATHGAFARLGNDEACSSRLVLWSNVLHLIAEKPWLGWGWGELDYAHFITLYNEPRFCDILDNAHNLPLHLAVELGLPLALLVCGGFAWWVLRQKPWAERDPTRQMAWAVLAVILLHSMLEYPLWYGPFQMAFGMCVILLLCHQKRPFKVENAPKKVLNRTLALVLNVRAATFLMAFILLLLTTYAAWDYDRISQIYLQPEARDAQYRNNTLNKIRSSWLFADQVRFAELMVTPLGQTNATWTFNTANAMLHYSPEPRVIEKLIESAVMLGRDDEALAYLARYRAAFPKEHALWAKANAKLN